MTSLHHDRQPGPEPVPPAFPAIDGLRCGGGREHGDPNGDDEGDDDDGGKRLDKPDKPSPDEEGFPDWGHIPGRVDPGRLVNAPGAAGQGDEKPASGERYDAAVANIRDTVKWLIGSIGAIFVTVLAGVQFNKVPFATNGAAAAAGIAAGLSLMITFGLAIRTLVGGSVSFQGLMTEWRLWPARRFIDRTWGGSSEARPLDRLHSAIQAKNAALVAGTIDAGDPARKELNERAAFVLTVARWHIVKWRFNLLVAAMTVLIPIELLAAAIMFSSRPAGGESTTVTIEFKKAR